MSKLGNERTSVSALMGTAVVDSNGGALGHVCEFAVSPTLDAGHVEALVVKSSADFSLIGHKSPRCLIRIGTIQSNDQGRIQTSPGVTPVPLLADDNYLLLERDLLDQQIIDVHGHKIVRVNDVDLVWEHIPETDTLTLRIAEVEVGMRGAMRRLLKGLPQTAIEGLACRMRASIIPWDFVDLIDRDPARRVRLKIEQDRLSRMHPSDLADILEELAPAEREALFSSLDEEVAAEALEEVEPRTQRTLIESLDSGRVAGILEEMDPGAAADILSELSDERSDAILGEMDPEDRQVVEDLLEYEPDSAAGLMTNDFLSLAPHASAAEARDALQSFEGDAETITDIWIVDEHQRLSGRVPLVSLMLAQPETALDQLTDEHLVTAVLNVNARKVAELFDKYNLRSLPVLDLAGKLEGVVRADQVITWLRSRQQ